MKTQKGMQFLKQWSKKFYDSIKFLSTIVGRSILQRTSEVLNAYINLYIIMLEFSAEK